jgi:hypothetical protein
VPLEKSNEYFKDFFEKEFGFKVPLMRKMNITGEGLKGKKDFFTLFKREFLTEHQERELKEQHFLDYELYNSLTEVSRF